MAPQPKDALGCSEVSADFPERKHADVAARQLPVVGEVSWLRIRLNRELAGGEGGGLDGPSSEGQAAARPRCPAADGGLHVRPRPGAETILGVHMLEVSPTLTTTKPTLEIRPLGTGGKDDPVRLVFTADAGEAPVIALSDTRDRLRFTANVVDVSRALELRSLGVWFYVCIGSPGCGLRVEQRPIWFFVQNHGPAHVSELGKEVQPEVKAAHGAVELHRDADDFKFANVATLHRRESRGSTIGNPPRTPAGGASVLTRQLRHTSAGTYLERGDDCRTPCSVKPRGQLMESRTGALNSRLDEACNCRRGFVTKVLYGPRVLFRPELATIRLADKRIEVVNNSHQVLKQR